MTRTSAFGAVLRFLSQREPIGRTRSNDGMGGWAGGSNDVY
jgi:hypothetical protein